MIEIAKKENMDYIELEDHTHIKCNKEFISLRMLRTLTHGEPYYIQFGFTLTDSHNVILHNKKIYKSNPSITKEYIEKIIKEYLKYKKNNNNLLYGQVSIQKKSITIKKYIIGLFTKLQKIQNIEEQKKLIDYIHYIYTKLYDYANYKTSEQKYILKLKK